MTNTPISSTLASWMASAEDRHAVGLGGKALGLLAIPSEWTPPYVVLMASFTERWKREGGATQAFATGSAVDWARVERLMELERELGCSDGFVVRSNAPAESSERRRGAYESKFVAPDQLSVCDGIDAVLSQRDIDDGGLCAIVQVAARRVRGGHLSNERRVTPRRTVWLAEDLDLDGARVGDAYTIDSRASGASLDAASDREVANALKTIAGHLSGGNFRCHCEWIWDGSRVWVVQRDAVSPVQNDRLDRYIRRRDRLAYPPRSHSGRLRYIRRVEADSAAAWSKSGRPITFNALGMPTAEVFLLTGDAYTSDAAQGGAGVHADLESLLHGGSPVVLRCDVRTASAADDMSLPTSDPLTDAAGAIEFMGVQADRFAAAGLPVSDWAFLPAHLVPARASVMVHARPGSQRVRLDALWGFPDGVGLLPHDTWFHDVASNRLTERVQHKGSCLAYDRVDGWQFQPVPPPHDWGHVLNEQEAATASSWAWRVADHLQREVQLMVLVRLGGRRGPEAMIPWHFTDHVVPGPTAAVPRAPERGVMRVTRPEDLPREVPSGITGFSLHPTVQARRDPGFLTGLGTMAALSNLPVYFEGSVLGHPFYLLRSAGATVVPVGADEPSAVQHEYDKLVRDRIPEIARRGGSAVRVMAASGIDAGRLLRHKLVEEAFEVLESDDDRLTDELADIIEVVRAFGVHTHATADRIEAVRAAKERSHGAFNDLVYLESTESSPRPGVAALERSRLFDEPWAGTRAAARNEAGAVALDRPDERTLVLGVSLVPPLRRGVPLRQYDVQIGEVRIMFTHHGPDLMIRIEQLESPPMAGQLSFAVEPS